MDFIVIITLSLIMCCTLVERRGTTGFVLWRWLTQLCFMMMGSPLSPQSPSVWELSCPETHLNCFPPSFPPQPFFLNYLHFLLVFSFHYTSKLKYWCYQTDKNHVSVLCFQWNINSQISTESLWRDKRRHWKRCVCVTCMKDIFCCLQGKELSKISCWRTTSRLVQN